jgi:hypothetical protein
MQRHLLQFTTVKITFLAIFFYVLKINRQIVKFQHKPTTQKTFIDREIKGTFMKKYPLFLLAVAYLGGCVGLFSSLYLNRHRSVFQELVLESDSLRQEILFFSKSDFSTIDWSEKGKEFEWRNKMYDVSKIEKTSKGYLVFCVNDDEEDGFLDLWKKPNAPGGNMKLSLQPQFCHALDFPAGVLTPKTPPYFSSTPSLYISQKSRAPSPPPRRNS